jgi:hypothetical protein
MTIRLFSAVKHLITTSGVQLLNRSADPVVKRTLIVRHLPAWSPMAIKAFRMRSHSETTIAKQSLLYERDRDSEYVVSCKHIIHNLFPACN